MHQNSAGASENMQADYKAEHALSIHGLSHSISNISSDSKRISVFKGSYKSNQIEKCI